MPIFTTPDADAVLHEGQDDIRKRYGVTQFEKGSIGFAPKTKTWYGWSHRAIAGFTVGSKVRKGDVIARGSMNDPPLRGHVFDIGYRAKTLADARDMAVNFAEFVS
jgi:hypothetical protein